MKKYDVIVVGLGAMGSAATYQLAKSGVKVLGIDQYSPPHAHGSTHGDTRITRVSVGEGAEYVALAKRSHELWRQIENETGRALLNECGGLIIMPNDLKTPHHGESDFLNKTIQIAKEHNIDHKVLTGEQLQKQFPMFKIRGNEQAYYETSAGYVMAEASVAAQLDLAKKYGADIKVDEEVISYTATGSSVTIVTNKGTYAADKLILTVGSWINDLFPRYEHVFKIYRQVLYWFDMTDKNYYQMYNKAPIFVRMFGAKQEDYVYGFPAIDGPAGGVKVATEHYEKDTSPHSINRKIAPEEIREMYEEHVKEQLNGLSEKCLRAVTCLYTVTPDHKFVIDFHPEHENVIIVSPCSGHGFKHSAAIGEALSQLAARGQSTIDLSKFSIARFKDRP